MKMYSVGRETFFYGLSQTVLQTLLGASPLVAQNRSPKSFVSDKQQSFLMAKFCMGQNTSQSDPKEMHV